MDRKSNKNRLKAKREEKEDEEKRGEFHPVPEEQMKTSDTQRAFDIEGTCTFRTI